MATPRDQADPVNMEDEESTWSFRGPRRGSGPIRRESAPPIPARQHESLPAYISTPNQIRPGVQSTEEIFNRMATSMTNMLNQFMERDRLQMERRTEVSHRPIPYQYAGLEYEDPEQFLNKLHEHCETHRISEDLERINIIGEQLRGAARTWFTTHQYLIHSYREFTERFLERFNSLEERSEAISRLYGEKQPVHEKVGTFLTRKRRMFDRLVPGATTEEITRILINQVEPELRLSLRTVPFRSIEDLIKTAEKLEVNVEEIAKKRRNEYSRTNLGNRPSTSTAITPRPEQSTGARPPTPCKFCGLWHYHSDCAQNPFNQRRQENRGGVVGNRDTPRPHTAPRDNVTAPTPPPQSDPRVTRPTPRNNPTQGTNTQYNRSPAQNFQPRYINEVVQAPEDGTTSSREEN